MTIHKALHPKDDIDRLNVSRKEGGRRLTSIEDSKLAQKEYKTGDEWVGKVIHRDMVQDI